MPVKRFMAFTSLLAAAVIAEEVLTEDFLMFLGETAEISQNFPEVDDLNQFLELPMLDAESAAETNETTVDLDPSKEKELKDNG